MDEDESGQEVASSDESVQMQFKDHFIFALSTSSTGCLQHASGFFLPVCKRNNTLIILFGQNAFDLLVALEECWLEALTCCLPMGAAAPRPDQTSAVALPAVQQAQLGFREKLLGCCWNLLKQVFSSEDKRC